MLSLLSPLTSLKNDFEKWRDTSSNFEICHVESDVQPSGGRSSGKVFFRPGNFRFCGNEVLETFTVKEARDSTMQASAVQMEVAQLRRAHLRDEAGVDDEPRVVAQIQHLQRKAAG